MENQKNNKGVIALLIIIIVILAVLCVLFATGTINFNSNNIDNKDHNENVTDNNTSENNQPSQDTTTNKNKVIINKNSIKEDTLNELLDIVGISLNEENVNNCLNIALSDNNYQENKLDIFTLYAATHNLNTYHSDENKCQASIECQRAYSCADCMSITKKTATDILKMYNFDINTIDFLKDMPEYNEDYSYSGIHLVGNTCNTYNITHNITTEEVNSSDINITDNQIITEFDIDYNYINTKEQTVIYQFKKDNENNFYLDNVTVK